MSTAKQLQEFAQLFAKGVSDRAITHTMGITLNQAHELANELRTLHGIGPHESLRQKLRSLHASYDYDRRGTPMVDLEQVRKAKEALKVKLNRAPWLRGIGIGKSSAGSYVVRVLVQQLSHEVREALPPEIEGVPVEVDVVGDIFPQPV